ncbi:hypothetical protein [Flavobacterium sp. W22_SRS_FP1]|uniref:hypothetical protein n=1 Tax=Flavobacterium sp. W22_SRS_FP1 TaxID=3240276 RepID=UPI003F901A63
MASLSAWITMFPPALLMALRVVVLVEKSALVLIVISEAVLVEILIPPPSANPLALKVAVPPSETAAFTVMVLTPLELMTKALAALLLMAELIVTFPASMVSGPLFR